MSWINLSAIWKIVVFGLLAGAGLPALFAIGLRALVMPGSRVQTAGADSDHVYGGNVLGLVIAAICFLWRCHPSSARSSNGCGPAIPKAYPTSTTSRCSPCSAAGPRPARRFAAALVFGPDELVEPRHRLPPGHGDRIAP